jgi:DNA-binding NarL/FixJ family response regulator
VLERVGRALRHERAMPVAERDALLAALRERRAHDRDRLAPFESLTPREEAVLGELMDGSSAEQIAESSFVSTATVRSQIRAVLGKLSVHSQVAAVARAHRAGWRADR